MREHAIKILLGVVFGAVLFNFVWDEAAIATPPPPSSGTTVVTKNRSLAAAPDQSHVGIAIADSSDHIAPLGSSVAILGNQAIFVDVVFETASATAVCWVSTYFSSDGVSFTRLTSQTQTATADDTQKEGGWFIPKAPLIFLTGVANYYELRMELPSTGRANVRHWLGSSRPLK